MSNLVRKIALLKVICLCVEMLRGNLSAAPQSKAETPIAKKDRPP